MTALSAGSGASIIQPQVDTQDMSASQRSSVPSTDFLTSSISDLLDMPIPLSATVLLVGVGNRPHPCLFDPSLGYITNTLIYVFQTELLTAASLIPQKPFPPPVFSIFVNVCTPLLKADAWWTALIPSHFFNFLLPGLMISTSQIYFSSVRLLSLFSLLH